MSSTASSSSGMISGEVDMRAPPLKTPSSFVCPQKHISELKKDLTLFHRSEAFTTITPFLLALNGSVRGMSCSRAPAASAAVVASIQLLDSIDVIIEKFPPIQQPQRFGNKAFRDWYQQLSIEAPALMNPILSQQLIAEGADAEVLPYLLSSFGDPTRIDYGTGHELNFVAWMCCLYRIGIFTEDDFPSLVLRLFTRYLSLMRKLQSFYWLEPAGSKGVWGLDDYQFLPLLWGASQLIGHRHIRPKSIHSDDVVDTYSDEYMYLGCIKFVKKMKTGFFAEHSPYLNDISAVPNWEKVNSGLIKMYHGEVLNKFPVVQHFLFGNILPFSPPSN